tara:strand:+ start:447 stop:635 length:189 start_codon:yes stop_codon:yes gene_type:complete
MAFKSAADGITSKGKTKGKNLGDSGPTMAIQKGGKGGSGGKTNEEMMQLGRGLAKVANQKRG